MKRSLHNGDFLNIVNPLPAKLIYLNFQPLEVVSRYRNPQNQVAENDYTVGNFRMFKFL